jgi:hypothetical protein
MVKPPLRETADAGSGHQARARERAQGEAAIVWEHVEKRREKGHIFPENAQAEGPNCKMQIRLQLLLDRLLPHFILHFEVADPYAAMLEMV